MKRFEDHVVMITGAANGIGKACALRFAEEGARVACLDMAEEANEAAAAECRAFGVEAAAYKCDVTDKAQLAEIVADVMKNWGRIDTLVASAGIYTGTPLAEVPEAQWQRTIDINLTGAFSDQSGCRPDHDGAGPRIDHQPVVDGGEDELARLGRIFRLKKRRDRSDPVGGDGNGPVRPHGERRLPREHLDGDGEKCGGESG
jgi:NAD(P)-dependent dehydrogenase (short-subunit alcohol dehydrogenase family)